MAPIKIIHVGLGLRGCHWLEAVRDYPAMTTVACVDVQASSIEWVRSHFDSLRRLCYQDFKQALYEVKADAAIISSPLAFRSADALAALEAGLAVMVEAPLAMNMADAVRILETSRRVGAPVVVGQDSRYRRCEQTMRELVREGKPGSITQVSYLDRRTRPIQGNSLNHIDYAQLCDAGVHHFDSLRSILGVNPLRVAGRCENAPWSSYQHGSTTDAIIEMENNIHIQYHGSLTGNRSESTLFIEGDRGILRADQKRVYWRKRGWRFFLPVRKAKILARNTLKPPRHATAALLDQLESAVKLKRLPESNGDDHLWTLAMMDAVKLSDKTGKLIEIAEVFRLAGIGEDSSLRQDRAVSA